MKKTIITFSLIMSSWAMFAQVQPNNSAPVQNPNTGSNVNTTSGNSNSGVNPNGNPGTIINATSNSNASSTLPNNTPGSTTSPSTLNSTNNQLNNGTNTNINTNTYPASTAPNNNMNNVNRTIPGGTNTTNGVNGNGNNRNSNQQLNNGINTNTITTDPALMNNSANGVNTNGTMNQNLNKTNINNNPAINSTRGFNVITPDSGYVSTDSFSTMNTMSNYNTSLNAGNNKAMYNQSNIRITNSDGTPRAIGLQTFAAVPVLATYVPEQAVIDIINRFGDTVYDIAMIKIAPDQFVYAVRVEENGVYRTERVNANMQ